MEYLKANIDKLEMNSKIKNIRDPYRDISDFKKGYKPRTNVVKDEQGDFITDSIVFRLGRGTISLSYVMYMGLMMLCRHKYIQQSHLCPGPLLLRFRRLLKS
jgi:hypothetical protein